ncbi:MAG: FMN-binding negative transcriptional regulator [Proteobacteria bacterium]|nr:FMN-binding negative transcriptional regulator [Pseudomonadota bacterium]
MYLPDRYAETDPAVIETLIAEARLGVLVTHGPEGLYASHLPFLWDAESHTAVAHLARANPHRSMAGEGEAMLIVQGADAYVSPGFYPSKAEDPRKVPTWNYEAVHLYGRLEWFDDAERLLGVVQGLTARNEAHRAEPWRVADAPVDYIAKMLRGIVGVSLRVERVEAKRKLSQNQNAIDRDGAMQALAASADPRARELAAAMRTAQSQA